MPPTQPSKALTTTKAATRPLTPSSASIAPSIDDDTPPATATATAKLFDDGYSIFEDDRDDHSRADTLESTGLHDLPVKRRGESDGDGGRDEEMERERDRDRAIDRLPPRRLLGPSP